MKFPDGIAVFGDQSFRGDCPRETMEQVTFFARIRKEYPKSWGKIALHVRNEGARRWDETALHKVEGMLTGASDIIIPGQKTFVCELKRRDHTKSTLTKEQREFLEVSQLAGAFVCIALGVDAACNAFEIWRRAHTPYKEKKK